MKFISTVLLLAGLAPASVSAGTDISRAAQLQPIDAGMILNQIQNSRNQLPQPVPSGLVDKNISAGQLEALLEDRNPEIRKAAVKSAKNYIQNNFANEPVLEIFKDRNERADIRVEAARTLSYASGSYKVQDAFTALLKYGRSEPQDLRVMTYKALYNAAAMNSSHQDFLVDAVKYNEKDLVARRAAVWALFASAQNAKPMELLTNLVKYGNEEELTRIEAIKSLYGSVGNARVRDLLMYLVRNVNERKPVRLVAIKALSGALGDSSVQRFVEDLVRYERDQELRVAAIEAAAPDIAELREYFHLGYKLENGGFISPIEKE